MGPVVVVVPVHGNAGTLVALHSRLADALAGRDWVLRLVLDASPDDSVTVAAGLGPGVRVTDLAVNVGQHRALERGLADEPSGAAWVCLDADLQDPPEAVPLLLDRLAAGDVEVVFAGRRGHYEGALRRVSGTVHRRVLHLLTGLPPDAGAFLALTPSARSAVLSAGAPSLVAALGAARLPVTSLPVTRAARGQGSSSWTGPARLRQSARTLVWAARARRRPVRGVPSARPAGRR